ncbi:MAG TPA: hypothetical protein VFX38_04555, partial [Gammaproteobacteria bacterium]|nr:hypothetical protein [Gammaproteobacteria bacterium]
MRLRLRIPATNTRGPVYTDQALAALHETLSQKTCLTLSISATTDAVAIGCACPPDLRSVLESQLYAQYPDCRLDAVDAATPDATRTEWTADVGVRRDLFPIKRYPQFEDALNRQTADPLTAILTAATPAHESQLESRVTLCLRPAAHRKRSRAEKAHRKLTT